MVNRDAIASLERPLESQDRLARLLERVAFPDEAVSFGFRVGAQQYDLMAEVSQRDRQVARVLIAARAGQLVTVVESDPHFTRSCPAGLVARGDLRRGVSRPIVVLKLLYARKTCCVLSCCVMLL